MTALDHVVLLEVPIRHSTLTAPPTPGARTPPARSGTGTTGPRHTRVHSDLYLFTGLRAEAGTDAGEEH